MTTDHPIDSALSISAVRKTLKAKFWMAYLPFLSFCVVVVFGMRFLVTHPEVSALAANQRSGFDSQSVEIPEAMHRPLEPRYATIDIGNLRREIAVIETEIQHPTIRNAFAVVHSLVETIDQQQQQKSEPEELDLQATYEVEPGPDEVDWRKADHISALEKLESLIVSIHAADLSPTSKRILALITSILKNTKDHHAENSRTLIIRLTNSTN